MNSNYNLRFALRPKLQASIEHLATAGGTLKKRLGNVFISHLISLKLDDQNSEVEKLIREAIALATSRKDETKIIGSLQLTLSKSGWQTDQKIAGKLFEAYELASKLSKE